MTRLIGAIFIVMIVLGIAMWAILDTSPVVAIPLQQDRIPRGYTLVLDETGEPIMEENGQSFLYEEERLQP